MRKQENVYADYILKGRTWRLRRGVATAETLPMHYLSVAISHGWPTISLPKCLIGCRQDSKVATW